MRVLTCNPPFLKNYSRQSRSPCVAKSGTIYFSYYLAYAGCAAELGGANVTHIDAIAEEIDEVETLGKIEKSNPDLVVIDTSTPSIISDIEFCRKIKSLNPDAVIICAGTFPSKNLDEFHSLCLEQESGIDGCFLGEYEETLYKIVITPEIYTNRMKESGVVWFDDSRKIFKDKELSKTSEDFLDKLPFVSDFYKRHLGENGIKKHFYASITWPYLQLLTARGCPYKCSFCNIPSISSYRTRKIESVVEEFKFIEKELSFINEVFVEDDTFPINKKRTIELCKALIAANISLKWSCNARVNTDLETLKWMKLAGCRLTCVGFESPAEDALNGVIKKTSITQQEEFMQAAKASDIKVNGCFIVGLPNDTKESIQNTVDYAKKLMPNTAQFYPHMVYPGTGSFKWAEENNLLEHKNWDQWITDDGFHNTPLKLNGMSSKDLLDLADDGRRQFYTNPRYMWKMLKQGLRSPSELQRMLKAGKTFFPLLIGYFLKR